MLAHRRALGHRRDRLGAQVLRVRRREADALDAVDRVERAQQVGELRAVLPGAEVAAVRVDVLAEQRDLAHAVGRELLDLVHDVAHAAADLGAAHDRHDAERARVVAADLDRDPRRVGDVAPGRQRRRVRLVLLEDLDDRRRSTRGSVEQRRPRVRGCGCRTRRRRARPARRSARGPSGPGTRRPRSGGRGARSFSALSRPRWP